MGTPKDERTDADDEGAPRRCRPQPPTPVEQTDHPVGAEQAAENRAEESPA